MIKICSVHFGNIFCQFIVSLTYKNWMLNNFYDQGYVSSTFELISHISGIHDIMFIDLKTPLYMPKSILFC